MGERLMTQEKTSLHGLNGVLTGGLLIGFSGIFTKWAEQGGVGNLGVGFYRMLFALPFIYLLGLKDPYPEVKTSYRWAWLAGAIFAVDLSIWHASLHYTTAANSTLLIGLAPCWVMLIEFFVKGKRPHALAFMGIVFAFTGAALLAFSKGARFGLGYGEILASVASMAYAVFMLTMNETRKFLSARRALLHVSLSSMVVFGAIGLLLGESFTTFTPHAWKSLLGLGLVVQFLGWWAISWGMGHISSALSSIGLLIQPLATIVIGWWLLGEKLKPLHALGAVFILLGIALGSRAPQKDASIPTRE